MNLVLEYRILRTRCICSMQVVLLENILLDFVYTLCAIYCHIKRNVNFNGMAMEFHYDYSHIQRPQIIHYIGVIKQRPLAYKYQRLCRPLKVTFCTISHLSTPPTRPLFCLLFPSSYSLFSVFIRHERVSLICKSLKFCVIIPAS